MRTMPLRFAALDITHRNNEIVVLIRPQGWLSLGDDTVRLNGHAMGKDRSGTLRIATRDATQADNSLRGRLLAIVQGFHPDRNRGIFERDIKPQVKIAIQYGNPEESNDGIGFRFQRPLGGFDLAASEEEPSGEFDFRRLFSSK